MDNMFEYVLNIFLQRNSDLISVDRAGLFKSELGKGGGERPSWVVTMIQVTSPTH